MRYDEVGIWSEIKLKIIKEYAAAYSRIISRQGKFYHLYIEGFAGAGRHISRQTGQFIAGSPLNALQIEDKFLEYHFIDLDKSKVESLSKIAGEYDIVHIHEGDCNEILRTILPRIRYEDYRRALCILDPYGLHLDWDIIKLAGSLKTVEIFLNFPVADMNRNVLWRNPEAVQETQIFRMNRFWGDESWREIAYEKEPGLFYDLDIKKSNEIIAEGFRNRLREYGGFEYVPKPVAMRNSQNAVVYYLFFAAQKPVAASIVTDIFSKYSSQGM